MDLIDPAAADALTLEQLAAIQAACTQVIVKYGYYADTNVIGDRYAEIFTEDAIIRKPDIGVEVQGRANFTRQALGASADVFVLANALRCETAKMAADAESRLREVYGKLDAASAQRAMRFVNVRAQLSKTG